MLQVQNELFTPWHGYLLVVSILTNIFALLYFLHGAVFANSDWRDIAGIHLPCPLRCVA